MLSSLAKKPVVRFLVLFALLYVAWYLIYNFILKKYTGTDAFVVGSTVKVTEAILRAFGYRLIEGVNYNFMGIDGTVGIFVGEKCNGMDLFALFSIFVISYPGKWKRKLAFIPAGIVAIFFINVVRVVCLAIIETFSYELTVVNHTYTFTIFVYAFIFLLWMIWANRFSALPLNRKSP